jgi:RNA polymerase sigma-70 factor (ECF subfamily)
VPSLRDFRECRIAILFSGGRPNEFGTSWAFESNCYCKARSYVQLRQMPDLAETRDIDLIRRLASGDDDAFLEFYRRHQGSVYRYALHMTGRPEAAADVVQEAFMTLIRQGGKFDEEKGAPAAFLYGIARNHVRKLYKKESRYVALSEEMGDDLGPEWNGQPRNRNGTGHHPNTFVEGLERAEIGGLLREAVLSLPDHYREPVTLCDLEGKSYSEAAALLECPVGTVRSRLNRARSILLEKLRPARMGAKSPGVRLGGKS